jgi:hypothetical protein
MNDYFSDLILSTITVEAKISNIGFKEKDLINYLSLEKKSEIYADIIKIGCNYEEYITDTYLELTKPVKKSNRGRKKKIKPISNRKIQGNGKYFNSQITFTILDTIDKKKFYHLKLFTNGTIQIPYVCNENIEIIRPIIELVINYIKDISSIKINIDQEIEIIYIKSIMRNYKFNITNPNHYIDLNKFQNILLEYKNYQLNYKDQNKITYFQQNTNYDIKLLNSLELCMIKCNFERYTGIILKFKTPIEDNLNKLTTVKIFSSGKINIDGSNNKLESNNIKNIILNLIYENKNDIIYTK